MRIEDKGIADVADIQGDRGQDMLIADQENVMARRIAGAVTHRTVHISTTIRAAFSRRGHLQQA